MTSPTSAGAQRLIAQAVEEHGRRDVLVNNAGVLRDAFLHRMTEDEWDTIMRVHVKGHFAPLRRRRPLAGAREGGEDVRRRRQHHLGLGHLRPQSGPGQLRRGQGRHRGADAGRLPGALALGVRVNAIAPVARTRLTEDVPGLIGELMKQPEFDPRHVSPLVAWLCSEGCSVTGKVYAVQGGAISELHGWTAGESISCDGDWTVEDIAARLGGVSAAA